MGQGAGRVGILFAGFARHAQAVALVLGLGVTSGCGKPSPSELAERERRALASLAGTARLVEDDWRAGAVPRHFAENALSSVSRSIEERRGALAAEARLEAADRRALTDTIAALDARIRALRGELARRERPQPAARSGG